VINLLGSITLGLIPGVSVAYSAFDNFKDFALKDWKPNYYLNDIRNTD